MTIYNFNLLVGYVSTGVDYAQAYRAGILRDICRQKYVFTEVPRMRELEYYTRIGILEEEILSVPLWFTGAETIFPRLTFDEVKKQVLPDTSDFQFVKGGKICRYFREEKGQSILFHLTDNGYVHNVEYYMHNTLLRKDHYSDRLLYSEYLTVEKKEGALHVQVRQVLFYDSEGSPVLKEYRTGKGSIYCLPDNSRLSPSQLLERFMQVRIFDRKDIFIVDRPYPHMQVLLKYKGDAGLVFVMHSKLTFDDYSDSHHWKGINYEYTDLVRNIEFFDAIVTSTREQADEMKKWFQEEYGISIRTCVIPAGGMKDITFPEKERKKHSLVTVSRLDHRKRIDLLIRAVSAARETIPDLTLDVYGRGNQKERYEQIIRECNAQDYISLKGHVDNFNLYSEYEGYISASLWETFGLTLLEAMSSGLALIGLDVPYGNRAFINSGQNGYLVPYKNGEPEAETVKHLSEAIEELFTGGRLSRFRLSSYGKAVKYAMVEIRKSWLAMLKEIGVDESDCYTW